MPTRVRSIWQRKPEPIPPPVVCRTEPIPLVNGLGEVAVRYISQTLKAGTVSGIETTMGITVKSLPGLTGSSFDAFSDWSEPEEEFAVTSLLTILSVIPAPEAPITSRTMTIDQEEIVSYLTTRYDAVVKIQFRQTERVLYNFYIDLGRLSRKEDWNSG